MFSHSNCIMREKVLHLQFSRVLSFFSFSSVGHRRGDVSYDHRNILFKFEWQND